MPPPPRQTAAAASSTVPKAAERHRAGKATPFAAAASRGDDGEEDFVQKIKFPAPPPSDAEANAAPNCSQFNEQPHEAPFALAPVDGLHADRRLARLSRLSVCEGERRRSADLAAASLDDCVPRNAQNPTEAFESTEDFDLKKEQEAYLQEEAFQPQEFSDPLPKTPTDTLSEEISDDEGLLFVRTATRRRHESQNETVFAAAAAPQSKDGQCATSHRLLCAIVDAQSAAANCDETAPFAAAEEEEEEDSAAEAQEAAFAAWKLRECTRLKRDAEERFAVARTQAQVAEFRAQPAADRAAVWHEKVTADAAAAAAKTKYDFLQKYYHKGAFFQDAAATVCDFDAPIEATRVDLQTLPQAMQVKNFGKKGRTKWTHLTAEDTTGFDASWGDRKLSANYAMTRRMGGLRESADRDEQSFSAKRRK